MTDREIHGGSNVWSTDQGSLVGNTIRFNTLVSFFLCCFVAEK